MEEKRKIIYDSLNKKWGKSPLNFCNNFFRDIEKLYDDVWFEGEISEKMKSEGIFLDFNCTSSNPFVLAYSEKKDYQYIINFNKKGLKMSMKNKPTDGYTVGGFKCFDSIKCIQYLYEHELIHILVNLYAPSHMFPHHGPIFMCTAKKIFGHTTDTQNFLSSVVKVTEKDKANKGDYVDIGGDDDIVLRSGVIIKKYPNEFIVEMNRTGNLKIIKKNNIVAWLPKKLYM